MPPPREGAPTTPETKTIIKGAAHFPNREDYHPKKSTAPPTRRRSPRAVGGTNRLRRAAPLDQPNQTFSWTKQASELSSRPITTRRQPTNESTFPRAMSCALVRVRSSVRAVWGRRREARHRHQLDMLLAACCKASNNPRWQMACIVGRRRASDGRGFLRG